MAKHNDLVAELLAMGGPFFYNDYKLMRTGNVETMVRRRARKARWALIFFVVLWGSYLALFLISFVGFEDDLVSQLLQLLSIGLYGGAVWIVYRNFRILNLLVARIDAGEFSTD